MAGLSCTLGISDLRRIFCLMGAVVLSACGAPNLVPSPRDVAIEIGRPFPNLILPSLEDGTPSSVARFRGKKTLLHVFASW